MATEPRTVRELNIAMAGIECRITILQWMIGGLLGLAGTLLIAAFGLYSQMSDIKIDVASIKSTVAGLGDRQTRMEDSVGKALASLNRIEGRLASALDKQTETVAYEPLRLSPNEIDLLRDSS